MRPILLLFVLLTASLAALVVGSDIHEWEEYKTQFEKKYNSPVEDDKRKAIHGIRKKEVDAHNRLYHRGERSYMQGINQFTDLTLEELQHYTGFRALQVEFNSGPSFEKIHQRSGKPLPISVDWRKKNVVTPVKNQGRCSSCWAFSATGSMEGQHSLKEGKLVSLSEKQLIDCIPEDYGCTFGGLMTDAFSYVIKNGIEGESDYPYVPHNGTCIFNSREIRAKFSNYKQITPGDENALEDAVATVGPISVAIGSELISSYTTGIFDNPDCNRFERDHAVLIVGYGVEGDTPYWIVKNSWGEKWGEGGYLRIVRGKNMCGITEFATYPVV